MEPITSSYVYDLSLHHRVFGLNLRARPRLRWTLRAWYGVFPVMCCISLVTAWLLHTAGDGAAVTEFLCITGFLLLCTGYAFWIVQHRLRGAFCQFAINDAIALIDASPIEFFALVLAGTEVAQWERLRPLLADRIGAGKC